LPANDSSLVFLFIALQQIQILKFYCGGWQKYVIPDCTDRLIMSCGLKYFTYWKKKRSFVGRDLADILSMTVPAISHHRENSKTATLSKPGRKAKTVYYSH
jgi:hypothetical protein